MVSTFIRSILSKPQPAAPSSGVSPRWVRLTGGPLAGREMFIDPSVPAWKAMADGLYEPFIFESLGAGGYEGKTVWDVGAFMGYHALSFAALVGETGQVVTFEPNPFNVERINQNLGRNADLASRLQIVTDALSNKDGETTFTFSRSIDTGHSSGSHMADAMAPEDPSVYESYEKIAVKTVRADTLLTEGAAPAPSIIKMDVEGAEALVLEGAVELLKTARPKILIEVHHIVAMFETQNILNSLGYKIRVVSVEEGTNSRCHVVAEPAGG